jgi:hypothetical protein
MNHPGYRALTLRSQMIAVKEQGLRNHVVFPHAPRAASGTLLAVLLLCPPALAGCGSPEEPRVQRVAFCQGPSSDNPNGNPVEIEFRQGSTVVARATGSVGIAFTVEVPVGATQIYVDGVKEGEVNEGVTTDGPYHSPAPDEITYLATSDDCPDTAPLAPS